MAYTFSACRLPSKRWVHEKHTMRSTEGEGRHGSRIMVGRRATRQDFNDAEKESAQQAPRCSQCRR